ncbi:hypothetical protein OV079_35455 [Nannocystis pusilla]|uniref:Uncharacterized protein n=1 Tax=Nannocystis pusilla TaxID=889268 RepID=A0A9X3EUY7_9BACT|nr:hypothetical protein [Nannocystis pusilla]MCY1010772.1 hypothetical protein [Nannocystis pusilla]
MIATPCSQVDSCERPSKPPIFSSACTNVSCTSSLRPASPVSARTWR